MQGAITVDSVDKRYVGRGRETVALDKVSLSIEPGELVAFVGPSGCGKSTLLNMIAGIIPKTSGKIVHNGNSVNAINRDVGYLTQADSVLPWRTVERNVGLPLEYRGVPKAEREKTVEAMLELVELKGFGKAFPRELSGGMRKRVALAQMLAYGPNTLLMDEPFGALDAQLKLIMQQQLLRIWQEQKKTIVFVTHDLSEAIAVASRVIVFSGRPGRIKHIENIDIPYPRDVFKVRFLPEFEKAYDNLWSELSSEIGKGEDL
ncbi:ABC transporter ATP-binding protein [Limoniibacter endophyticus]|uniref:ABC transporter ATP-binding protein n=1 Tax=Limoniibacter endophyticus TaxID=1565040 RepID=A0A8J3DNW2_9HYPH|nr:ABC transporter ATP-binding protein [Limoniibacter endophyticus]GHC67422.1 ABC transporter ATP-binding protein [Limoniibacter endophyticus]